MLKNQKVICAVRMHKNKTVFLRFIVLLIFLKLILLYVNLRPTKDYLIFKSFAAQVYVVVNILSQVICFSFVFGYGNVSK